MERSKETMPIIEINIKNAVQPYASIINAVINDKVPKNVDKMF
jgi:hypothetical protein